MAIFRQVHCGFWVDPKVLEEMTPEDRYFMLYLLTNPNTTQIGIYQISKKTIAFELGYSPESINALMDRFINNHKIIKYNEETRELAIVNWGKYNLVRGGKPMVDCIKKELEEVKDLSLISVVGEYVANETLKEIFINFNQDNDTLTIRENEFEDEIIEIEENVDETIKKKDDKKDLNQIKEEMPINAHYHDTTTIRTREGDNKNNNNNKNNNKNNNNNKEQKEEKPNTKTLKDVVVVLENKITIQEAKAILKVANGNIELIKAKYAIAKVSKYENLVGFMKRAIENDYQMPKKQENIPDSKIKTKFHNFEQRTNEYTPDELKQKVLSKSRNGKRDMEYIPQLAKR